MSKKKSAINGYKAFKGLAMSDKAFKDKYGVNAGETDHTKKHPGNAELKQKMKKPVINKGFKTEIDKDIFFEFTGNIDKNDFYEFQQITKNGKVKKKNNQPIIQTYPEHQVKLIKEYKESETKMPWEMNFKEFYSNIRFYKSGKINSYELPDGTKGIGERENFDWFKSKHRKIISKAIQDGKSVSIRVLDEYPELKEAQEHKETFEKIEKGEIKTPEDLGKSISLDHNKKEKNKKHSSFIDAIEAELKEGKKHNKLSVEKLALKYGITNKNIIKEFTELAIVRSAKSIVDSKISLKEKYNKIVELYKNQVSLSHRTSQSMLLQQYSTPAPISFIASLFVKSNNKDAQYFEPSAGNGLLAIALPYENTIVNELDEIRLKNLQSQPFKEVLNQDATIPFVDYYHKFDGVVTNPPFGTLMEALEYDGYKIKTLDHLMALRALDTMKDDGKAAIIIGGHTEWDSLGRIQAGKNRLFFNYLYSHYNVEDVILINGKKLYSRQGTSFDTRLILVDGRKEKVEGFAPLKNNMLAKVMNDFDELWERVFFSENKSEKRIRIAKAKAEAKLKLLKLSKI